MTPGVVELWLHRVLALAWLCAIPVALVTDLKTSIEFLVTISLWALVGSHWAAAEGAKAEAAMHEEIRSLVEQQDRIESKLDELLAA